MGLMKTVRMTGYAGGAVGPEYPSLRLDLRRAEWGFQRRNRWRSHGEGGVEDGLL